MSNSNIKDAFGGHADMPQQPAPAATSSPNPDFPPQYEANVNENLRNFGQPEGQVGTLTFDHVEDQNRGRKISARKKALIIGIPILIAFLLIALAAIIFTHSGHDSGGVLAAPSQAANVQAPRSADPTTGSVTITTQWTITTFETTTKLKTETVSASIPKSIAKAASSWYNEKESSIAKAVSSISEQLVPSPITSSTTVPTSTSVPFETPVAVPQTSTTSSNPTTTISETSTTSATASGGGRIGFCGAPGTPCLVGRDADDGANDHEGVE